MKISHNILIIKHHYNMNKTVSCKNYCQQYFIDSRCFLLTVWAQIIIITRLNIRNQLSILHLSSIPSPIFLLQTANLGIILATLSHLNYY